MERSRFEPSATRDDRGRDGVPWIDVSLDDWRERLKADPRRTVAILLRGLAVRRSTVPGVEDFFWRVLADHGTPDEVTEAVLGRLRPPGAEDRGLDLELGALELGAREPVEAGSLLDLDREHRVRIRGRLRVVAADAVAELVRSPAERDEVAADPVRLAEAAFAHRRRWSEAAALFALEHDHLSADDPVRQRLARASLRYQVARALHRVEGHRGRAIAVMESTLPLLDLGERRPAPAEVGLAGRLVFHAREWLGLRHFDAGRYREAEAELRSAAAAAPATDLALAALMFAANAMIRDGRPAEARELLDSIEPTAGILEDDLSERWSELRQGLARPEDD